MSEEKPRQEEAKQTVIGQAGESCDVFFVQICFLFFDFLLSLFNMQKQQDWQVNRKKEALCAAVTVTFSCTKSASRSADVIKHVGFLELIVYAHYLHF